MRAPDRAHDMMSRDSACRLCATLLAMSARGMRCLGTLWNPWTTPRCQSPCHHLQYLPCFIAERVLRPVPAPGAGCTEPRASEVQYFPTRDGQEHVSGVRCASRCEPYLLGCLAILCLHACTWNLDLVAWTGLLLFLLQDCRILYLLFPVSPSSLETDHVHQGQTGMVQRCSGPHGQPETIFYVGCYKGG